MIDATDNAETRFLLNESAGNNTLLSAALLLDGRGMCVFDANQPDSPCYQCLYPNAQLDDQLNCAERRYLALSRGHWLNTGIGSDQVSDRDR